MSWLLGGVEFGELYHESVSGDINVLFSVESVHKNPRKILLKSLRSFVTILFFHGLHAGRNSEADLQLSSGRRQVITSSEVLLCTACASAVPVVSLMPHPAHFSSKDCCDARLCKQARRTAATRGSETTNLRNI